MNNQQPDLLSTQPVNDFREKENPLVNAGFVAMGIFLVLVYAVALLLLNYFNIVQLSRVFPFLSSLPRKGYQVNQTSLYTANGLQSKPIVSHPPLESCMVQQQGNPLVDDVSNVDGVTVGTFRGIIQKLAITKQAAIIEIISQNGQQTHTFSIFDINSLAVYDGIHFHDSAITNLHVGQTITITFNCNPKQGNIFRITSIGMMSE